ncbi:hypothetical protein, partial [Bacillus pumilus]|uniref:hypothetical protein n=1 Tax=Bacillus pumilus TaxID=1408 RepID=UPI001C92C12F
EKVFREVYIRFGKFIKELIGYIRRDSMGEYWVWGIGLMFFYYVGYVMYWLVKIGIIKLI